MALILLRHTRPDVARGICYGRSDIALADSFDQELADMLPRLPKADAIVSSPLARCRILAEAIGAAQGIEPGIEPDLGEMDFGGWEMRAWDAIPRHEIDAWAGDFFHARPHGGESVDSFLRRIRACLAKLSDRGGTILAVTHAGVIRAALAATGRPDAWEMRPDFASIWTLGCNYDLDQGMNR